MAEPNATGASEGLSEDAASGIAYLTFIPAIIFLVVAPYNTNPKVKFHAWQSIFLAGLWVAIWIVLAIIGVIPFVNFIDLFLFPVVGIAFLILWLITMIQAFQGKRFKIPVLGNFAEKQAGA
jgi:uncharacterized membrane protein